MKLQNELEELQREGIISQEVAQNIQNYLNTRKIPNAGNNFLTIFGVFGALLIGLGLILILAHNWDDLPKLVKTIIAFIPLIVGQLVCLYILIKPQKDWMREALAVFTGLSVGLAIAMVHQIYHLPENELSDFILIWVALVLPLVYLMKSKATALLYVIGISTFTILTGESLHRMNYENLFTALCLYLAILPFYYGSCKKNPTTNQTAIFHWVMSGAFFCLFVAYLPSQDAVALVSFVLFLWLYIHIGRLLQQSIYYNAYKITGVVGLWLVSFFILYQPENLSNFLCFILIASVIAQLFFLVKNYYQKDRESFDYLQLYPILLVALLFVNAPLLTDVINLFLGAWYLRKGIKNHRFLLVNFGLAVISVGIIRRFFDSDISFVIRGIVFVLLGIGFFTANYFIIKKGKKNA